MLDVMYIHVCVRAFMWSCNPTDREAVQQLESRVRSGRTSCGEKASFPRSLGHIKSVSVYLPKSVSVRQLLCIRPSKLDCLFSAMETLLLHAGGRFIFIIHCHFLLISYSIFKNLELVCEGFNTHEGPGNDCKLLQKRIQKPCCSTNHCKKS